MSELDRVGRVDPPNERLLVSLATTLMLEVGSAVASDSAVPTDRREWVLAFRRELERSYASVHDVRTYAATLGISTRTLNRATGDLVGQTAKELIDARIALEAQRLLTLTSDSSAEIAYRLGFSEATNFSRFFARTVGMTPHRFRASHHRVEEPPAHASDDVR